MSGLKDQKLLNKLIYISGSPRGGSTVFFDLFSKNKSLHKIPGMTHFYNNIVRHSKSISPRLLKLVYKIPLWHDVETISKNSEVSSFINSSFKNKRLDDLYKCYVLSSLLYSGDYKDISKFKYWVDKTNDWRGLFWVNKNFPLAIFLFIIRDPRSVCFSIVNRGMEARAKKDQKNKYLKLYIKSAVTLNHLYCRFLFFGSLHNNKSFFTSYENVVNNGHEVLNNLYEKILNETLSENEISSFIQGAKGASSHSLERGRYQIKGGINNSALTRWSELDTEFISIIEIINSDIMRFFNYEKITSNDKSFYFSIFKNVDSRTAIVFLISKVLFKLSQSILFFKRTKIKKY